MDDEAEEEEEEDQVAGLGDFGFTVASLKVATADEDERVQIRDDAFDNIVDELSDGEGDEKLAAQVRIEREKLQGEDEIAEVRSGVGPLLGTVHQFLAA